MVKKLLLLVLISALYAQAASGAETEHYVLVGKASWYGRHDRTDPFPHIFNADGSRFDEKALTCAMRRRDFGGYYRVTNLANGKSVFVRHRDYGPSRKYRGRRLGRIVDLSKEAFRAIADLDTGVIRVRVERVG